MSPTNFVDRDGRIAFVPLLVAGYALAEAGLSIYDTMSAISTIADPCASTGMKIAAGGGAILGIIAPGGGYGGAARRFESLTQDATGFFGSRKSPLRNADHQSLRNSSGEVSGRHYTGHAFDQMQNRGIMPSVVDNAINTGTHFSTRPGTHGFYDAVNDIRVIVDASTGRVVRVIPGKP